MINIERAIVQAWLHQSSLGESVLDLEGMSSPKTRHLLNNLCNQASGYIEIGCWKGSTLISAAYGNKTPIWAMDNFSEFQEKDDKDAIEKTLHKNINRLLPNRKIEFVNADFRKILSISDFNPLNVNLCFVDGCHSEESQYDALIYLEPVLNDEFVLLVDDWNHEPARKGTMRAINDLSFKIHENYWLPAKFNGDCDLWWNGLWVARITKE